MNTILWKVEDPISDQEPIAKASAIIRAGGLVAFPTETVYGLGANALDGRAVRRIFEAKGRPQDNPLIAHIPGPGDLDKLCRNIPPQAYALCERFWPGPLTLVLKSAGVVSPEVTAGLDTVAVRSPDHPVAIALISACGVPVAAPSANLSGRPSPTEAAHVISDLSGKIDAVIDGGPCTVGVESTVLDLTSLPPRILRPGGITLSQIREVCPDATYDKAVFKEVASGEKVRSPGMKYRHYAPRAKVIILRGGIRDAAAYIRFDSARHKSFAILCYDEELPLYGGMNAISYGPENRHDILARRLFSSLRRLDQSDAEIIYARCPEGSDSAAAVENRLKRAAAHNIIDVSGFADSADYPAREVTK